MSLTIIMILISCAVGLLLVGKLVTEPAKIFKKIVLNSLLGIFLLWLVNTLGIFIGFNVPLNVFTVLLTGILGIPGLAMLGLLQLIVK